MDDLTDDKAFFKRVVQRIDPQNRLIRTRELRGGVSARVTLLEMERPDGRREKMVLRQHGEADLRRNPRIAADEFRLLQILQSAGLPAPAPYAPDSSGDISSEPCLVMEFIEGKTEETPSDLTDYLHQLALQLSRIHQVDASRFDLSFLPKQGAFVDEILRNRPSSLKESWNEERIRDTLERAWPWLQVNPDVLLHGDYWPGNLLWKEGRLVAVIDWEDAAIGDPLADVANARLEILWAFGMEAMHRFTDRYQSMMPSVDFTNLPYWDLYAALRPVSAISGWGLDPLRKRNMRERHQGFVAQALEKLGIELRGESRLASPIPKGDPKESGRGFPFLQRKKVKGTLHPCALYPIPIPTASLPRRRRWPR
jgi:aminoglycoside phosphotransferase (APT) family kinase protein